MAIQEINSDIDVLGRIYASTIPNATGSIVTWNSTTRGLGLRTNAQIISDLNLNSNFVPYTGATANVNLGTRSITSTGGFLGNATTSTTLATARTINGTSFNGSANITTARWGTARNITIGNTTKSVNGSANVSWSLAEIGGSQNLLETLANGNLADHTGYGGEVIQFYNPNSGGTNSILNDDGSFGLHAAGGLGKIDFNSSDTSWMVWGNGIKEFQGITGDAYYGANYTDNTYVQKKYVDDRATRLRIGTSNAYASGDFTLLAASGISIIQFGENISISSTITDTTYSAGTGLSLTGTTFANTAPNATHTGDVTGATALTIANSAVTHAKYQNIATQRILGRGATGAGNVQELTLGSNLSLSTAGVLSATNTNTTYSAGTGLSLSGTTFNVNYGTAAGTSAQGNDSRINNGQTAFGWGDHASEGYLTNQNTVVYKPVNNTPYIASDIITNQDFDLLPKGNYTAVLASTGNTNIPTGIGTIRGLFRFGANHTNLSNDIIIGNNGLAFRNSSNNTWRTVWTDTNFDPAQYVPTSRTLTAGNGLSGGGNLTANRTFTLGTPSPITLSSTDSVTSTSHTHSFKPEGTTAQYIRGDGSLATMPTFTDAITAVSRNGVNIPIVSQNVDIPIFSTSGAGLVPARVGSVATKYLREDGTWVTPTNTTYSAGTLALLQAGTNATNRVWSASILSSWLDDKGFSTQTLTAGSNISIVGDVISATNTNTTYTAGAGLSLTGTAFSVDNTVIRTTGTQTLGGVKTFTSQPIVPTATSNNRAVNLGQLNSALSTTQTTVMDQLIDLNTVEPGEFKVYLYDRTFDWEECQNMGTGGVIITPNQLQIPVGYVPKFLHDISDWGIIWDYPNGADPSSAGGELYIEGMVSGTKLFASDLFSNDDFQTKWHSAQLATNGMVGWMKREDIVIGTGNPGVPFEIGRSTRSYLRIRLYYNIIQEWV